MPPFLSLPSVYLNSLEHDSKTFIRLYYKPDHRISKRLKEASWIRYSKTYKCFVTHHSSHIIELLHQHFAGMALVNTAYLNKPKRLRPAEGAVVLAENLKAEPLSKYDKTQVVRLLPLMHENQQLVQIRFPYNKQLYLALKQVPDCWWLKESRCFVLKPESAALHGLLDKLQGLAQGMAVRRAGRRAIYGRKHPKCVQGL